MNSCVHRKGDTMFFKQSNHKTVGPISLVSSKQILPNNHLSEKCFSFSGCVISDIGYTRVQNGDNFLFHNHINETYQSRCQLSASEQAHRNTWHLAGVFDGISSCPHFDVAAKTAAKSFRLKTPLIQSRCSKENIDVTLRNTFREVNNHIFNMLQSGTTATILCTNQTEFKIFHLGDSRAYLFREGKLHQLTRDQTLAQLKIDAGLCAPCGSGHNSDEHILTDYVGREQGGYPTESSWIRIQEQDHILLCSDGLHQQCSNAEIIEILHNNFTAENQAIELVHLALLNGACDNITCIVLHFHGTEKG